VVPIKIPPLRERKNDIHPLVNHLLKKSSDAENVPVKRISKDALELLMEYHWPGNVRELENVIERCVAFCNGDTIMPEDLPNKIRSLQMDDVILERDFDENGKSLSQTVEDFEKKMIYNALKRTRGNKTKAAEILRMTRKILRYKVEKYDIQI
jgi:DNA-binding NtrC family response regulator